MSTETKLLIGAGVLALIAIAGAALFRQDSAFARYAKMVCAESKQACEDLYATTDRPE